MIKSRKYLFFLMNWSALYTSTNGPVYDAIAYGMPFINYPPFVKTKELEGLRHLEYNNFEELNEKVRNVNQYFSHPELIESLSYYKNLLEQEQRYVARSLVSGQQLERFYGEYGTQRQLHNALFAQKAISFIDRNEALLRKTIDILIIGKPTQYNPLESRFIQRTYLKRMQGIAF